MEPLKIGITGIRGTAGESFTPELVVEFAQALWNLHGWWPNPGLSRHAPIRTNGLAGASAGLLAAGCEVIDLGICTTPSMQLAITQLEAVGEVLDNR